MSKKQFTLDSWLKDKSQKVVTRCGFPVRIVCTDVKRKDYPILALVERDDQEEYQSFTKDGRFSLYNPLHDNFDLFIVTDEVCEDEKVRKELIKHLKEGAEGYEPAGGSSDYQRWLAWVEDQGMHKPVYCHHEVDLSNCSEEYRKAYYDGWNNCNMQYSQCKSESNDVVKCLINGMKFYYEDNEEATWGTEKFSMKVKDILTWLERQGDYANFRDKAQVGDRITKNEDGVLVNLSQLKRMAKPREKQGEKHPEPYNGISFEYNGHIWGMCARDNGVDISCDKHLIKHLEKQGEQKPADSYCQENCKGFQETGKCFADGGCKAKREAEQKPKENKGNIGGISPNWSEEDEENFCSVYLDVKSARQNTVNSLSGELKEQEQKRMDEVISWLKSLRPQNKWKPSDEQISLLQAIINEPNNAASESCQIVLKDILEQFKKLKESKV